MLAISVLEWFTKFPALWAVVGLVVGGFVTTVVSILINRKFGEQVTKSTNVLVDIQAKQLASMEKALEMQKTLSDGALAMQKDHYDAELTETRRKAAVDLETMTEERNTYRTTLHDERNVLGTQLTEAKLKIAELEARPDLTSLLEFEQKSDERRESFYKRLGDTMETMSKALKAVTDALAEHDAKTVERMKAFIEPVLEAMREVVDSCNAMKGNARKRKQIVARAGARLKKATTARP